MHRASEEPDAPEEHGAERRASEYQGELLAFVAGALGRAVEAGASAMAEAAVLGAQTRKAAREAKAAIADAAGAEVIEAVRKAVSRAETGDSGLSGIDSLADAKRTSQRASSMVDAAAQNANRLYWEALQRVRNPANRTAGYEEELRREVARLAREGVTAYSYRRRNPDGTYSIVKVPVDVGLRREIETACIRANNDASLRAAASGGGLVEVSCTANPRKSHREWEGRVYRVADPDPSSPLYETVMRYPRFADVVGNHMQDYNCKHQVRPWREGQPRWRDPLEGTVYTPEEGSRIMARQAAMENEVRKTKREVEALQAAGLDAAEAKRRLTAKRRQVQALVAEHPKLLKRRPWREGIYEGARKADGTYGRVHLSDSGFTRAVIKEGNGIAWSHIRELKREEIIERGRSDVIPIAMSRKAKNDINFRRNFYRFKADDGFYAYGAHGLPGKIFAYDARTDPGAIWDIISGRKDYSGEDIQLLSCFSALKDEKGYCTAQELADISGKTVRAPDGTFILKPDGSYSVLREDGSRGSIVTFVPRKQVD